MGAVVVSGISLERLMKGNSVKICEPRWGLETGTTDKSGSGSVVGMATAYGLDGGGEIFRTCPDRPWGPRSLLYNGCRVFPGGKVWPGRDADPSPLSSAEVKNRVELYLYSP
jgi:hypothetical protein